jgi:hypothetical protein
VVIVLGMLSFFVVAPAARAACIGNFSDDFADGSIPALYSFVGTCGTTSETGGVLEFAKSSACTGVTGVTTNNAVAEVCGDFDISVDFDLGTFPAATSTGGRYHSLKLYSTTSNLLLGGVEHYRESPNVCIPYANSRKAYTTVPGCPPDGVYVAASTTQGSLRLRRVGTTLEAYHTNGAGWELVMSRAVPTDPVRIQMTSGTNGALQTGHVASFDNLTIESEAPPVPVLPGAAGIVLRGSILVAGATLLRRRRFARRG